MREIGNKAYGDAVDLGRKVMSNDFGKKVSQSPEGVQRTQIPYRAGVLAGAGAFCPPSSDG
jgi:hypothetical protein